MFPHFTYAHRNLLFPSRSFPRVPVPIIQFNYEYTRINHTIHKNIVLFTVNIYRYTRQTACVSWHGFQDASKTITRLAPTKLIPREPALVETRNRKILLLLLNSFINFSLSKADVLPSRPVCK